MATRNNRSTNGSVVTGWLGWIYFAAFALLVAGIFHMIAGLTALLNSGFYVVNGTAVVFDLTTWGWIHLLGGVLLLCTGTALFTGRMWARVVAVIVATLSLIANFVFISYHPVWSIIAIVLDVLIVYALTVHGDEAALVDEVE